MKNFEDLVNKQLDVLIATHIMGEERPVEIPEGALEKYLAGSPVISAKGWWVLFFDYNNNDCGEWLPMGFSWEKINAINALENRLAELNLVSAYIYHLAELVFPDQDFFDDSRNPAMIFKLLHATNHSKCIAALKAFFEEKDIDKAV